MRRLDEPPAQLFETSAFAKTVPSDEGNYYPTKTWVAQRVITERVPLTKDAFVLEPTCGDGRWLDALPPGTRAFGVEVREDLATLARAKGHRVITGDILTVPLPNGITHAIGNPPFVSDFIDRLLMDILHPALTPDGMAALLLPTYYFQTSRHVWDLHRKWSIDVELIPRDIYEGLSKALCLARFTKSTSRRLMGLFSLSRNHRHRRDGFARSRAFGDRNLAQRRARYAPGLRRHRDAATDIPPNGAAPPYR